LIRTRSFLAATLGLLASCLVAFPADGQTAAPGGLRFSASATGTALYVGALQDPAERVAVRAGFSGATVSAAGLIGATLDEFGATVATGGAGRHAEARGRGLDVNGLVVAGAAEAAAPPTAAPVADETSVVDIPDVASVSLARGEAAPTWSHGTCVVGRPLSFGSGRAHGVVLPVAAVDVARSDATTQLRPAGDTISVVAEAHQGAATIRLLPGTPEQTTIEVLGETVLRARADGNPGGAALEYAAVGTDPAAPFLRITRGKEVVQLTSQQVFGGGVALAQTPVMDLRIGEAPRGFDTAGGAAPYVAADGTAAHAVVDLLRVQLLTGGPGEMLDVRIGHMEAEVTVPAGGVRCPVPVSNVVDEETVLLRPLREAQGHELEWAQREGHAPAGVHGDFTGRVVAFQEVGAGDAGEGERRAEAHGAVGAEGLVAPQDEPVAVVSPLEGLDHEGRVVGGDKGVAGGERSGAVARSRSQHQRGIEGVAGGDHGAEIAGVGQE
jgi:hypothetical protein